MEGSHLLVVCPLSGAPERTKVILQAWSGDGYGYISHCFSLVISLHAHSLIDPLWQTFVSQRRRSKFAEWHYVWLACWSIFSGFREPPVWDHVPRFHRWHVCWRAGSGHWLLLALPEVSLIKATPPYIYIYVYICMNIYIYIYICMNIYIYIYIYIYRQRARDIVYMYTYMYGFVPFYSASYLTPANG